jgi:hypothetical protein
MEREAYVTFFQLIGEEGPLLFSALAVESSGYLSVSK